MALSVAEYVQTNVIAAVRDAVPSRDVLVVADEGTKACAAAGAVFAVARKHTREDFLAMCARAFDAETAQYARFTRVRDTVDRMKP